MSLGFITRLFPFIAWLREYSLRHLRLDAVGGVTVALVLIPQSMAYAQLAGLPAYYGLYAAFLPPTVAALFGSSRQLATGPVAIVSLMTAAALEPIAVAGSEAFIAYAILLALMVGLFQLALGILRLGMIVNFLSHPVVSGFTNAAALIIASSQLSKVFGVSVDKGAHHYDTIINVVREAMTFTHLPTLAMAVLAFAIMIVLRRLNPKIPNVLLAVLVTTLLSWGLRFEKNDVISVAQISSEKVVLAIEEFNSTVESIESKSEARLQVQRTIDSLEQVQLAEVRPLLESHHALNLLDAELADLKEELSARRTWLRRCCLGNDRGANNGTWFLLGPEGSDNDETGGGRWRINIANGLIDAEAVMIAEGGAVVGTIPKGLPRFSVPQFDFSIALHLFSAAMVIALLGFMEAISIAKAMAARTGQRLDVNQELIGQGLANLAGSFFRSYAVSGSFSRSAVNIQAGAVSGLSNVVSSVVVVVVLLFLTPLLYHLPQASLAAIIMVAVIGLVNVKSFVHAWRAQWHDGLISIITFVTTLVFAPHLDRGIMIGVALSLLFYLLRNTRPAVAMLSLHIDGSYRNRDRFELAQCPYVAVIRYSGSLVFCNVEFLENQVIDTIEKTPKLRHLLLVGNGINELDTSGVDALSTIIDRIRARGSGFSVSGLNDTVLDVMERTGLVAKIGENNFYRNVTRAIEGIWDETHTGITEPKCPLRVRPMKTFKVAEELKKSLAKQDLKKFGQDSEEDT